MADKTSWTEERFRKAAKTIQKSDPWQAPQAWAYGVMHCFKEGGEEVQLMPHFNPAAINCGTNLNLGSLAHVLDVVGPEVYGNGVLLTKKHIKELRRRVKWVERDGKHCNVEMLDAFKFLEDVYDTYGCATKPFVIAIPDLKAELASIGDSYLRDYLFSMGLTDPEVIDCGWTSRFALRPTFAVTNLGIMTPAGAQRAMWDSVVWNIPFQVFSVDKVPFMLDHVVPDGVRVPAAYTVRLGGYLQPGTTVMPSAGYVNIEAVAGGMVEGRHSGRVRQLGTHNDVGGGVSIMGTMSGGNDVVVTIGSGNLLEAQSGLGIPLGDRNRVCVGTYVKSTSMVRLTGGKDAWATNKVAAKALALGVKKGNGVFVKAEHLSGINDAIFRRNDFTGVLEAVPRGDTTWGSLNELLHAHN